MSAIKIAQKQIYISQDGNSQVYDGWCFTVAVVFLEDFNQNETVRKKDPSL